MTRVQRQQRWFSAEELHARVGPPTWCRMRIRRPILRVVNCSEFFRNVTVFGRMVTAHDRADPNRLNERDHPCQDRQQVRYRYAGS